LQKDIEVAEKANADAITRIAIAEQKNSELASELELANKAKNEHQSEVKAFIAEADSLAGKATDERLHRNKAEKALNWYRARWWGAWASLGAACVIGALVWIARAGLAFKP
jgi:hypothetical protein